MLSVEQLIELARQGASALVEAGNKALQDYKSSKGDSAPLGFAETIYELPCHFVMTNTPVKTASDMPMLTLPANADLPTIGESTLLSAELLLAIAHSSGQDVAHIPDKVIRELGYKLVDGTIPGVLLLLGKADDPLILVDTARDAQARGLLAFLCGPVVRQLQDAGVELGLDTMLVPLHETLLGTALAASVAVRAGLIFGGVGRGERARILHYLAERVNVTAIHFGDPDATTAAVATAAWLLSIPVVVDRDLPAIEHKLIPAVKGEKLLPLACEARGIKTRITQVDIPIPFGSAFEGERVRKPELAVETGNNLTPSFEILTMASLEELEDGRITIHGDDINGESIGINLPFGIVIRVGGNKMQEDFATVIERRLHDWFNRAMGVMHIGQRDVDWLRISRDALRAGFQLRHLGSIAHACIHADFGAIVDRVQVDIYTNEAEVLQQREKARRIYRIRDERLAGLTDEAVDVFYSCLLCQSFAPNHVCIVTPERMGLCGSVSWLDARASHELSPTGACSPVERGTMLDEIKGDFTGVNEYVHMASHGALEGCTLYSLMDRPMTSCGCFEVVMVLAPEANGVVVVGRDDTVDTPMGMGFSTLAGTVGGGSQVPGFMGIGKRYIISRKFLRAEDGILRLVWMPAALKATLQEGIIARAAELGEPDFLTKIATEEDVQDLDGLLAWLEKVKHPVLQLKPMF